jgi:hypothetical protein
MMGFDFADPDRGISGSLRPSGAAVVFDHDDVVAAGTGVDAELGDGGMDATASVDLEGASLRLELSRLSGPLGLRGERAGSEELAVCRVLGEVEGGGRSHQIACLGIRSDAVIDPGPEDVSLTRSIAVAFADGGILALRAGRPPGASHGDEEIVAALGDPDGEVTQIREPLLSTQYDSEGRHVRATLELWPEQDEEPRPPFRAAGSIVCGTSLALGERRLDIAFFRWSMDGRPGLGRYEVLRAAGD